MRRLVPCDAGFKIGGKLHAYGHEEAGLSLAESFLARLTGEVKLHAYVKNQIALHMRPNMMVAQGAKARSFMGLFDRAVCPEDLLSLAKADYLGRQGGGAARQELLAEYAQTEEALRAMLALYRERMARPGLMGRDLVEAGVKPGPLFREALSYAHKLQLAGIGREEQLRQTLGYIRKKR